VELGDHAAAKLQQHWQTFITLDDFTWLASMGINAVRIPLGHWILGAHYPYHPAYGGITHPFVEGGIDILDQAFDWADELDLAIVLDLHAAPGCQNGFDNGGIKDVCEWHTDEAYIEHSLWVLEQLAQRYQGRPALHAIEVLNEPRWEVDLALLKHYTTDAYYRIRQYCSPDDVAVVFHDGFRPYSEYLDFLAPPEFDNTVFDIHRYQCFTQGELAMDIYAHIRKSVGDWKQEADAINKELGHAAYVGEWSLGMDLKVVSLWASGPFNHALETLDAFQTDVAYRAYASAHLATFETYRGWFFWSYKTETTPAWCFRDCVNNGWLPGQFGFD
jgi:glucan 1,3-beta-glucosidase